MSITINGNGTITGYTPTTISGTLSGSNMPSGSIIQTVIGASDDQNASSVEITSQSATSPTFFNSACNVTLTPQFSNSKILITFTAQIRFNPDAEGYVGVYYSGNSNFSSDVNLLDPKRGGSRNESFRINSNDGDAHHFWTITQTTWDKTVSNTNTRYYSVGGYKSNNEAIYYGDQGVGLTMMAQEIKA
tara:strand:+ start:537 stop:1103 length:567 start_codon:yes stop_codon:yes gene_type:complete